MPRPPGNADKRMLDVARKIVFDEGCSGLRIREVAARAGVNLGMFHYHFKNKSRFKRAIFQEFYEKFFEKLSNASKEGATAAAQLRSTLFAMSCFMRDERRFYLTLAKDLLNEDPDVIAFVSENLPRHASVIHKLITQCQAEGSLVRLPFHEIMPFLMSAINMPTLIMSAVERHQKGKKQDAKSVLGSILTDEAISRRIDFALKGLRP